MLPFYSNSRARDLIRLPRFVPLISVTTATAHPSNAHTRLRGLVRDTLAGQAARDAKLRATQPLELYEALLNTDQAPLRIDEDKGIIFGVKVLGRYSPNNYGLREAVNGTEYPPDTMRQALSLYEGVKVRVNHLPVEDRRNPDKERRVEDTLGVLRNLRVDGDCIRGDLHCNPAHSMTPLVIADVKNRIGAYGLSHNAGQAKERFDRTSKRLVIESIGVVRSVDLVDKPATNRNLWESQEPTNVNQPTETKKYTLRSLLESQRTRFSQIRLGWMDRLLEDDGMATMADTPAEMPAETAADPADAMRVAFRQAADQILDGMFDGSVDEAEGFKKLKELCKTHCKLTQKDEPEEAKTESEEEPVKKEEEKKGDKTESVETKLAKLERKDACRDLCESLGFTPTRDQLETLMEISTEPKRKVAAEAFKAAAGNTGTQTTGGKKPRSSAPTRDLHESRSGSGANGTVKIPEGTAGEMGFLRRG